MPIDNKIQDEIRTKLQILTPEARTYKDTTVEPKDRDRYRTYYGDPDLYEEMFPKLSQFSSIVDTSVRQSIERKLASHMKMFFGTDDVGTIQGRTVQWDANAEKIQELCNWQIIYKNQGYLKFYHWIKDAEVILLGAMKVTWKRETEETDEVVTIPWDAIESYKQQAEQNKVTIALVEPNQQDPSAADVTIQYEKVTENYPVLENVPPSELMWTPNARTQEEANFFQRKRVTLDYLRRNIKYKDANGKEYGMYNKKAVASLAEGSGDRGVDSLLDITIKDSPYYNNEEILPLSDPAAKVEIIECYIKHDINGDGMTEDVIATMCGDVLLRCDENTDGNPFCLISPMYDPHRIIPKYGPIDTMAQWQHLKTAIIRQMVQNLANNNSPTVAIQPSMFVNLDQVIEGDEIWEVNGNVSDAFKPVSQPQLAPYTLEALQMISGWQDDASGISAYQRGLDDKTLNKTATGVNLLIGQGAQSLELEVRNFAETGIKRLFERLIFLNQKYIDEPQLIKLLGQDVTINPEDLKGEFEYTVNAGMGAGTKQSNIQNLELIIGQLPMQIQLGIANQTTAYNTFKNLYEAMGIKNFDDYLINPAQQQPQAPQGPKESETMTINLAQIMDSNLPTNGKIQAAAKFGIQLTQQDFAVEAVNRVHEEGVKEIVKQEAQTRGDIKRNLAQSKLIGGMPGSAGGNVNQNPPGNMANGFRGQRPS